MSTPIEYSCGCVLPKDGEYLEYDGRACDEAKAIDEEMRACSPAPERLHDREAWEEIRREWMRRIKEHLKENCP